MDARSRRLRWNVAAALSVVVAIVGLVVYDVPSLVQGAAASPNPYWLVLGSFASDVVVLVAAVGTVRGQRWGVVFAPAPRLRWRAGGRRVAGTRTGGTEVSDRPVRSSVSIARPAYSLAGRPPAKTPPPNQCC